MGIPEIWKFSSSTGGLNAVVRVSGNRLFTQKVALHSRRPARRRRLRSRQRAVQPEMEEPRPPGDWHAHVEARARVASRRFRSRGVLGNAVLITHSVSRRGPTDWRRLLAPSARLCRARALSSAAECSFYAQLFSGLEQGQMDRHIGPTRKQAVPPVFRRRRRRLRRVCG